MCTLILPCYCSLEHWSGLKTREHRIWIESDCYLCIPKTVFACMSLHSDHSYNYRIACLERDLRDPLGSNRLPWDKVQFWTLNLKSPLQDKQTKKPKVKHQPTKKSSKITPLTCELELSANLANALALDKSIRSRKNGKASLKKKRGIC